MATLLVDQSVHAGQRRRAARLPHDGPWWARRPAWVAGLLLCAAWAAAFPLVSELETHRVWGVCAAVGYAAAAATACGLPRPRARTASLVLALAGAVVVPLLYLVLTARAQSEVGVIERSGTLLLQHATPYLPHPRSVGEYTPYLPGMAVFGVPRAGLGADDWVARLLGDARVWCAAAFLMCLRGGRMMLGHPTRRTGQGSSPAGTPSLEYGCRYGPGLAALVASPVVALPLCVSGVDLPLTGLCALALACAARGRPVATGLALAAACSLKWTAWPAIAVAAALLAVAYGGRAALRATGVAVAGTVLVVLPSALLSPGALVEQVLAFPTGRGAVQTPASSPLPGHLLAEQGRLGWCAAVGLLLCGGLAVAASLVVRPPSGLVAAADRLAAGLCVAFLLAPAGRFGYLALPVVLVVWARLADPVTPPPRRPAPPPADAPARRARGGCPLSGRGPAS
ncbi:glycosyltransferase 87 family protein [Streptomyces sp. NPDC059009]|uniref:glycosyltransferase 87 family protein n=1 Tax=Streptomyces sp. NPDC059009 TaxID=3346694 RepID=UPI00367C4186